MHFDSTENMDKQEKIILEIQQKYLATLYNLSMHLHSVQDDPLYPTECSPKHDPLTWWH